MILKFFLFLLLANGQRPKRTRRQTIPSCKREDLPLQPFSTWSCSGSPERCTMICNTGFERSTPRKGSIYLIENFQITESRSGPAIKQLDQHNLGGFLSDSLSWLHVITERRFSPLGNPSVLGTVYAGSSRSGSSSSSSSCGSSSSRRTTGGAA